MNAVEELALLSLDQAEGLVELDLTSDAHGPLPTQQLLDELLGRFEEDDSPILSARRLASDFFANPTQE